MIRPLLICSMLIATPLAAAAEAILVNTSDGALYMVDTATLRTRHLADTPQFFDIAVNNAGEIHGVTGGGDLWQVDPQGGKHVHLGNTGVFVNALVFDGARSLMGAGNQGLYFISTAGGRATLINSWPRFNSSGDLAIGPGAVLYATGTRRGDPFDTLYRIDPQTLEMAPVGQGIGYRRVYGLVWSSARGGLVGVTEAGEMIEIDPATGMGRLIGQLEITGKGFGAAGFGGDAVVSQLSGR